MAKKANAKVKRVASRGKRVPRTKANEPLAGTRPEVSFLHGPNDDNLHTGLANEASRASGLTEALNHSLDRDALDKPAATMGMGDEQLEFGHEATDATKLAAVERARKIDLKIELQKALTCFRNASDARLKRMSDDIEAQLHPLVQTVADIAVTRKGMEARLAEFEDTLSALLGLKDELDPIEIDGMFSVDSAYDAVLFSPNGTGERHGDDGDMLAEATEAAAPDTFRVLSAQP
jgi:hypothetical protein